MAEVKLKRCPFCGNKNAVELVTIPGEKGFRDNYCIRCNFDSGGCGAEGGWRHYPFSAINAWNCRYKKGKPNDFDRFIDGVMEGIQGTAQTNYPGSLDIHSLPNVEMNDGTDSTTGGTASPGLDGR